MCFYFGIGVGVRVELLDCAKECAKQESEILSKSELFSAPGGGGGDSILKTEANALCARKVKETCGRAETPESTGHRFPSNVGYFATGVSWKGAVASCIYICACVTSFSKAHFLMSIFDCSHFLATHVNC